MTPMDAYRDLEVRFKRINVIGEALSVLHWDAAVMMPPGGAAARGEQLATLRVLCHDMMTDPKVGDGIDSRRMRVLPWNA